MVEPKVRLLRLANFKAFSSMQEIPIKPLTLIYGANSSGKSSILHALALASHAAKTGALDVHQPKLGGGSIDLGGFLQYSHRHKSYTNVMLGFESMPNESSSVISSNIEFGINQDVRSRREVDRNRVNISVKRCEFLVDHEPLFEMSSTRHGFLKIDRLDSSHDAFAVMLDLIRSKLRSDGNVDETKKLRGSFEDFVRTVHVPCEKLLPHVTAWTDLKRIEELSSSFPLGLAGATVGALAGRLRQFRRKQKGPSQERKETVYLRVLRDLIDGHSTEVESFLDRMEYLGPFRPYPSRSSAQSSVQAELEAHIAGANLWDWISKDQAVREDINKWLQDENRLQTPYKIEVENFVPSDRVRGFLEGEGGSLSPMSRRTNLDKTLNQFIADPDSIRRLVLRDQNTRTRVSFRDVGVGISQVLPILIATFAAKDSCIAIEQPELHLHPGLQADLADVFLSSALNRRNRFLVETHSEHMILRVLRRIRESRSRNLNPNTPFVSPEDVCVVFVEAGGEGAEAIQLPISENGEFELPWPGGFFAERRKEL